MPNRRPLIAVPPDSDRATLRDVYSAVESVRVEFGSRFDRLEDHLDRRDQRHDELHRQLSTVIDHAVSIAEGGVTEKTIVARAARGRREQLRTILSFVVPIACVVGGWLLSRT